MQPIPFQPIPVPVPMRPLPPQPVPIQFVPSQPGFMYFGEFSRNFWQQMPQPNYAGTFNPYAFPGAPVNTAGATRQSPAKAPAKVPDNDLTPDQFTANNLGQENLDRIVSKYGADIDDIYRLSPGQKWMFGRAQKVTNAFFLQMFFKVTMNLKPSTFRRKLDEVSLKRTNLRTAFAYRGMDEPYQVVLKNRRPELRFIDRSDKTIEELREELEDFRISDRRRGFDLENDPLLRITIFSTAEKDTYAIVSSQPHINDDGASEMMMFKEIFVDYALGDKIKLPEIGTGSYQNYAKWLESLDRESELKYWKELLADAPQTRLPGRIDTNLEPEINTLLLTFSPEEDAVIPKLQTRYGATLNSIAQSAWGVMLQKIYNTDDVVFGSITSGRSSEVQDSNQITGGFVNAFPVRVKTREKENFSELIKRVQSQIFQSQEKAHFSPDELGEKLGRKTAIFDHLLNFHNFAGAEQKKMPALPGFTILGADNFDNLSTGFCLYFQKRDNKFQCLFTYDRHLFTKRKIELLMSCYKQVFQQILADENKELLVEDIQCPDIIAFLSTALDDLEEQEKIQSFLENIPLFEGVEDAAVAALAKEVVIKDYADNDEILHENQVSKGLDIVMSGFVESFRTARNGWTSSLLVLHSGNIVSATGILDNMPSYTGATAVSDEVSILHIPKETAVNFFARCPRTALNLIKDREETAKKFSFFWINADG